MSEWKESTLGDELIVQRGHDLPKISMVEGQYPVCSSSGILGYHNAYTHDGDGLTIGRSGHGIGKVFYYQGPFWAHNTVLYVKDFKGNFPKFFYYFLKNLDFTTFNTGSAIPSLNRNHLYLLNIKLPVLAEQKAIASVLSSLDDKIDLLHRQNKTLEAMAETLFRQWFIEEAKEDWEDCILGDILEVLESGSRPKGGIDPELKSGIPSLGAESINGICKFDYSKVKYVTLEFADSCKKGHAQPWDVLIYKDGAYVGKKALFGEKFPYPRFMINEHVFRLRSNTRCSQLYLYFALDSESLALLNSNSAQPGINQQSLKSYQITLPPKEKMEAFDSVVRPLTIKMNENAIQISTCEKLRDTLLPKLMSGEVRVQYQTEEVA